MAVLLLVVLVVVLHLSLLLLLLCCCCQRLLLLPPAPPAAAAMPLSFTRPTAPRCVICVRPRVVCRRRWLTRASRCVISLARASALQRCTGDLWAVAAELPAPLSGSPAQA
jgi:hypothetical protein